MNNLLPNYLKDTPSHIFAARGQHRVERHLLDTVMSSITLQVPLDKELKRQLSWRFNLIGDLIDASAITAFDRDQIVTEPWQAINIVAERPFLFPLFKDLIMKDPEAIEQMFYYGRVAEKSGEPIGGLDESQIIEALKDEPRRLLNVLGVVSADDFRAAQSRISRECDQRRYESPAWAFEWISRNEPVDGVPLDRKLVETLSFNEGYAFRTMRLLRDLLKDSIVWEGLEQAIRTPRWAYHALRDELMMTRKFEAEEILLRHPGWTVELLVDKGCNRSVVRSTYLNAVRAANSHELIGDLNFWYRSTYEVRMLHAAAAKVLSG